MVTLLDASDFNQTGGITYYGFRGPMLILGSEFDDIITSRDYSDDNWFERVFIFAQGGADNLTGRGASDVLDAGAGDDVVYANGGDDLVFGRGGADILDGGAGNDIIFGGWGNDIIAGGKGRDTIRGGTGNDTISGGHGYDKNRIFGQNGDDVLYNSAGGGAAFGGAGDDDLYGREGRDWLNGGTGNDTLTGGDGGDWFVLNNAEAGEVDTFYMADQDFSRDRIVINIRENTPSMFAQVFDFSIEDDIVIRVFEGGEYESNFALDTGTGTDAALYVSHGDSLTVVDFNRATAEMIEDRITIQEI